MGCLISQTQVAASDVFVNGSMTLRSDVKIGEQPEAFLRTELQTEYYNSDSAFGIKANIGLLHASANEVSEAYAKTMQISWSINADTLLTGGWSTESWGRADELNPVDFAFPEDRRWRYYEAKEDRKTARLNLGLKHYWGDSTLTLLVFPKAINHDFPESDSPWCDRSCQQNTLEGQQTLFEQQGFTVQTEDAQTSTATEAALRFSSRLGSLDYALSGYYGSDHWQRVQRTWLSPTSVVLQPLTKQNWNIGLDGAYALNDWVVRGELAYLNDVALPLLPTSEAYGTDQDGLHESPIVSGVIAIEHNGPWGIFANLQLLHTALLDDTPAAYLPREFKMTSLLLSKTFYSPEIDVEFLTVRDQGKHGSFSNLLLDWHINMNWRVGGGYIHFSGNDPLDDYGYFAHNNRFYLRTHYTF